MKFENIDSMNLIVIVTLFLTLGTPNYDSL
jgi:hypothetical protein